MLFVMKRLMFTMVVVVVVVVAGALFLSAACNGGGKWNNQLYNELLDYPEIKLVSFTVVGNVVCQQCLDGDIDVVAMRVEVLPKDNPLAQPLAVRMIDGASPFTISNLRYKPGAPLDVLFHLYTSTSLEDPGIGKTTEISVPGDDGETVAVTINF